MGRTSRNKRAGLVIPGAVVVAADRAGAVAAPLRDRVIDSAGELAERTAPLRDRVIDSAGELAERTAPLRDRVLEGAVELRDAAAPAVGEALVRGGAAWEVLRGDRVGPPRAVRRWPWAIGAALAGAAAGAVVAALLRKVAPADAPGAQEPHELRAVVDSSEVPGTVAPATVPTTPVVRPTPEP